MYCFSWKILKSRHFCFPISYWREIFQLDLVSVRNENEMNEWETHGLVEWATIVGTVIIIF